ncbi:hypothetical protein [Oceaniglobus trochenteri]|uniref:hypothetical protein n=1 Tax=Oceaniglobus trochenteri TaxID=2763260 RepID=UPI001CFFE0CB|nr:hypothetical protein [Oceaniglobus trochenteri]
MKPVICRTLIGVIALIMHLGAPITSAQAEILRVRTAEHDGFTRIVVDLADRFDWKITRSGKSFGVRFADSKTRFDLSGAFRRISDRRIEDITDGGNGTLGVLLSCECQISTTALPNDGLMIDIQEEGPTASDPWSITSGSVAPDHARPRPRPGRTGAILPIILPEQERQSPASSADIPLDGAGNSLTAAHRYLLLTGAFEQMRRAEFQGLVDFKSSEPLRISKPADDPQPPAEGATIAPPDQVVQKRAPQSYENIRIETQVDLDSTGTDPSGFPMGSSFCGDPGIVDPTHWFAATDNRPDLATLYADITDDRGKPVPEAYAALARRLIYLSFGKEALFLLKSGPEETPERKQLLEMATLLEGGPLDQPSYFGPQLSCNSAASLWAILANDEITGVESQTIDAVVRTISSFPIHLRRFLGPRLAERMIEIGETTAALAIRNAVLRGDTAPSIPAVMLEAKLQQEQENEPGALHNLTKVSESRSELAAEAFAILLENALRSGETIAAATIEQAQALEFEVRPDGSAGRLTAAITQALTRGGDYTSAFERIRRFERADGGTEGLARQRSQALTALAETASDAEFLNIAMRETTGLEGTDPARVLVADRLAKLGLPGPARKSLGAGRSVPSDAERYVRARIALLEGEPGIAESYLTGLETKEATALREEISRESLHSVLEDGESQEVSEVKTDEPDQSKIDQLVIARNKALLEESRKARDELKALLEKNAAKLP